MASKKHIRRIEESLAAGDAQTALALCQKRLRINPRDADIIQLQTQALMTVGDFSGAVEAIAIVTAQRRAPAEAHHMHAYALIQMDRKEDAYKTVQSGLKDHPDYGELLQYAGLLADQLILPVDSERYYQKLTSVDPDNADAWLGLGNAQQKQGRDEEALTSYKTAAAADPTLSSPLVNAANMLAKSKDQKSAQAAYQQVLQAFPDRIDVRANLAASLVQSEDYIAAVAEYDGFLRAFPDDFDASLSRAKALLKGGDAEASVQALTNMARRFSDRPEVCPELVNACLFMGDAALANSNLEIFLERFPKSADVYSCISIIQAALHPEKFTDGEAVLDAEIQGYDLTPPEGYADAAAFFDDVCAAVYDHPSLMDTPADHATIKGFHTKDIAKAPVAAPIAALIDAIKARVRDYARRPETRANPYFDGLDLESAGFNLWAVVMREGGHQEAHIHPAARISGVVYCKVPSTIRDSNDRAGWIEFGRPHREFHQPEILPTKLLKPTLGRIVIFPSHAYHATLPLSGADHRISLAFDIVG
ncbi:MAG: tetratricopeptide repeat protein [Alphaproteobacteria bacterium]|nr:tetratricopeptide repeat protein [Alphaproteobacteria bacterium]